MQNVDINTIVPYKKNAKLHPLKQIKQVAKSIKEFGFNQPIVVDKNNVVIVGHGRLEAAKLLELKEVPVLQVDLTEEKAKAYRLADNKLNESSWDMDLAIEQLKELSIPMFELTGFDKDLLLEIDGKDDLVPELPREHVAQVGDIWQLGNHRIMCGDSVKKEDIEKLMDGKKADMVFTDPPYGINYEGGSKKREKMENDTVDVKPFYTNVFTNMLAVCKKGASAYIWHASIETHIAIQAFIDSGWDYKQDIIWNKNNSTFGRRDFHWKHEPCIYGWVKGSTHNWYGDRKQVTVWDIDRPLRSDEHSTIKPVKLGTKAITLSSKQDDIVLDLFLGSGSTLIAAEKTGRICYGMEIDPCYVDVIIKRWELYTNKKATKL